jgi:hypothetical protein
MLLTYTVHKLTGADTRRDGSREYPRILGAFIVT